MSFLLTHLINIVIIAIVIAGLAAAWAFAAAHNAKKRDGEMQAKQDKACENCSLASMCTRFGQAEEHCQESSTCDREMNA